MIKNPAPILEVDSLSLGFGTKENTGSITSGVSFQLYPGQVLGIVGESGSGKSLTARAVMGLLPPGCRILSGSIRFKGTLVSGLSDRQMCRLRGNHIAMLFQDPLSCFNPLHRIGRQVGEGLAIHTDLSGSGIKAEAAQLMAQAGLAEAFAKRFPHQLSGGQRQRAMLAMMLASRPEILIADEPTTALDAVIQNQVLALLARLKQQLSLSLILITHDLAMVRKIADRICVMREGKIVEAGNSHDIFTTPSHPYTRMLLKREDTRPPRINDRAGDILRVKNLNVFYPAGSPSALPWKKKDRFHAVKQVSFDLRQGECMGIVGESGSGKSSLGLALLGLIRARGSICFLGEDLVTLSRSRLRQIRPKLQIVFQDPLAALNPRFSVEDCIAEGLRAQSKFTREQIATKVAAAMAAVELDPAMKHRYPHEFSGGQCQRICLARAIVMEPRCIVFDEPTSSLDRNTQFQVMELLSRLQRRYGLSSLFIAHDLELVKRFCQRILIMYKGEVVEQGLTRDIFALPQHKYTRKLLDAAHMWRPETRTDK